MSSLQLLGLAGVMSATGSPPRSARGRRRGSWAAGAVARAIACRDLIVASVYSEGRRIYKIASGESLADDTLTNLPSDTRGRGESYGIIANFGEKVERVEPLDEHPSDARLSTQPEPFAGQPLRETAVVIRWRPTATGPAWVRWRGSGGLNVILRAKWSAWPALVKTALVGMQPA